ncbi:hypothetical protein [Plesiomonas shigelloides]|nr:hypothetical protein [Plesiomonas shigelloides]
MQITVVGGQRNSAVEHDKKMLDGTTGKRNNARPVAKGEARSERSLKS